MEEENQPSRDHIGRYDRANCSVKLSTAQLSEIISALEGARTLLNNAYEPSNRDHGWETLIVQGRSSKSWWGRHCCPNGRRFLYKHITLITVILQFLNLMVLTVIDVLPGHLVQEYKMLIASSTTMIVLQVANLFILILATGRLARQVLRHNVNRIFLAQSYLATLLLFAGLYTLTYRLHKHSWKFLNEDLNSNPVQVFNLYFKFLFYSISTATLCGSDNALPVYWYNHLFAGTQMLLSFCYFASILGLALNPSQYEEGETSSRTEKTEGRQRHSRPRLPLSEPGTNTLAVTTMPGGSSASPHPLQHTKYPPLPGPSQQQQQQQQQQQCGLEYVAEISPEDCEDCSDSNLPRYCLAPHSVMVHDESHRLQLQQDPRPYKQQQQQKQQQQRQKEQQGTGHQLLMNQSQFRPHSYCGVEEQSVNIQHSESAVVIASGEDSFHHEDDPLLTDGNQTMDLLSQRSRSDLGILM